MQNLKALLAGFVGGMLLLLAMAVVAAAATAAATGDLTLTPIWLSGITFLTVLAGFGHQYLMKRSERKWAVAEALRLEEKEDRAAAALAAKVEAAARDAAIAGSTQATQVAMTLFKDAAALALEVKTTAERLAHKVEQGTERVVVGTEKAYNQANHGNEKIAELQESLVQIGKSLVLMHERAERTETAAARAAAATDETCALRKRVDAVLDERIRSRKGRKR